MVGQRSSEVEVENKNDAEHLQAGAEVPSDDDTSTLIEGWPLHVATLGRVDTLS